jgi:3-methyladenine DNA glycosylase AlkD
MKELESLGSAQTRKTYARHGVGPNQFGVSYANFNRMAKQIKKNQDLAVALWESGNHDARVLALKIADPESISSKTLDQWVRDLDNYVIAGELAGLAAKTKHARSKMKTWSSASAEMKGQAGWTITGHLAMTDGALTDQECEALLKTIERDIHQSKNRVRHAMYMALIAIGVRNEKLQELAIAAAKRIGHVEIDHGDTNCKTPDAVEYIKKTVAHRRKRMHC